MDREDQIYWKLTATGVYMAALAYKRIRCWTKAPQIYTLSKSWAPPKCKFSAWIITQNHVQSTDRLAQHVWTQPIPLSHQTMETAYHLLAECRFTRRIWNLPRHGQHSRIYGPAPRRVAQGTNTQNWWTNITNSPSVPHRAMQSLTLLITW